MSRNRVGVHLKNELASLVHKSVKAITKIAVIPAWILLAGPFGDFKLVFTVAPNRINSFLDECIQAKFLPLYAGKITENITLQFNIGSVPVNCDLFEILNLCNGSGTDHWRCF